MKHSISPARWAMAVTGAVFLLGATASCGLLGSEDPKRDEPSGQITESSDADVFALQVGDCMNSSETVGTEISDVPVVPCSEPHESEIYAELELPEGDYPADLDDQADAFCLEEFSAFVGVAYEEQDLDTVYEFGAMTPTADGWDGLGDRIVQCVVYPYDGSLVTGSMQGLGTAAPAE